MMRISSLAAATVLLSTVLQAQGDVLYYKFDAADTTRVVNYAAGPQAAPATGTTRLPVLSMVYAPGRFGSSLQASPYVGITGNAVHTGWSGPLQGDLTIAFFLKNRNANSVAAYSPVAGQPGWSLATGGTAGYGLELRGWGGPDLYGSFGLPVCSMTGWNHFAVVLDATAGTATWYLNGAVASSSAITTGANLGAGELYVGTDYVTSCGGLYDVDEFRLGNRAASAAEIADWATGTTAATAAFDGGPAPDVTVDPVGAPAFGTAFAARVRQPGGTVFALAAGTSYAQYGALALPVDISTLLPVPAGGMLRVSVDAVVVGSLDGGMASVPLPVPNLPTLAGFAFYLQGFGLDNQGHPRTSNVLAASLGR